MEKIRKLNGYVNRFFLVVAALLSFLLAFLVVADVIGRTGFNHPVKGTTEIVSLSIVVICFLEAGYAISSGGMLKVDMLVSRGGPRGRAFMACLAALAGLVFFGIICYGSVGNAIYAWTSHEFEGEGALRVPVWPARFVVLLGSFLACVSYLLMLLQNACRLIHGDAADQPTPN